MNFREPSQYAFEAIGCALAVATFVFSRLDKATTQEAKLRVFDITLNVFAMGFYGLGAFLFFPAGGGFAGLALIGAATLLVIIAFMIDHRPPTRASILSLVLSMTWFSVAVGSFGYGPLVEGLHEVRIDQVKTLEVISSLAGKLQATKP